MLKNKLINFFYGILFVGIILFGFGFENIRALGRMIYLFIARTFFIIALLFSFSLRWSFDKLRNPNTFKQIFLVGLQFLRSLMRWAVMFGKNLPWFGNWAFAIGFVVVGITLFLTFTSVGIIFIIIGILIAPLSNDLFQKFIHTCFAPATKLIIVLLGVMTAIVYVTYYETNEKQFLAGLLIQSVWLDLEDEKHFTQLREYFNSQELKQKKKVYIANHVALHAEIKSLFEASYYQKVVDKGTPYRRFADRKSVV